MNDLLEHCEGVTLAEMYTLGECLGGDGRTAFYRSTTKDGARVVIKVERGGNSPLDLLRRTRQLRHPNLLEVLDYGETALDGGNAFYAVFEAPDDTLASAISREPLDSNAAREVLDASVDALRYLHAQGLVIGALDADHVVAVGDRIKLSTDMVRDAETSAAYREDVRLLGELWRQALMAASAGSEEIAAHAADPDPKTRWTLAEIYAALNPPPPVEVVAPPQTVEPPAPVVLPPPPVRPMTEQVGGLPRDPKFRFPRWILVGTGLFLLILFAMNRSRHVEPPPPPAATPAVPLPAPVPKTAAPAPQTVAVNPPKPASSIDGAIWRVIAFTYSSRDSAEKKVRQLNEKYPGLKAAVFSPHSRVGYYLVSLGGRMTREDAMRLQRTARSKGLPRDLYIQNYSD